MFYLRFCLLGTLLVIGILGNFIGGWYTYSCILLIALLAGIVDNFIPQDKSEGRTEVNKTLCDIYLYSNLPLLFMLMLSTLWLLSGYDFLNLGLFFQTLTGYDANFAKAHTSFAMKFGALITLGSLYSVAGSNIAHELVHRVRSKTAQWTAKALVGFTLDGAFMIAHVFCHHRLVATPDDPTSPKRGESAWHFTYRTTLETFKYACKFESKRLERKGKRFFSLDNNMLTPYLFSAIYFSLHVLALGLIPGTMMLVILAMVGKTYVEFNNYVEHYGLLRLPTNPVEPRHSWNSNHALSSWMLFQLPRHAQHHKSAQKPYWELEPKIDAPEFGLSYLALISIAAIPPLWFRYSTPKLLAWDEKYARPEEAEIIHAANIESKIPGLAGEITKQTT